MAVSFTDEDPDSNKLGGQITVHPAVDQDNIFSYSLYWSSEMPNLLAPKQGLVKFGEALACSGCDAIYVLESNYLLRDIQYFVAFSKNPYGESNKFAFTEVKDLFVPRNSLSFYDKDLDRHEISGIITVNHATNNPLILTWHVYLGTARQWNILDLAKKDAVDELVFIIPDNTVSEALTHIFADGLNHLGTSIDARLLKIHDRAGQGRTTQERGLQGKEKPKVCIFLSQ